MAAVNTDPSATGEQIKAILRRCRGRPRLTDADRAQRRLESRKKYDVRRVYLGEAHRVWSELRRRTSLSDAGLAEYLILLNSAYGEKYQQKYGRRKLHEQCTSQRKGKKVSATSLQDLVNWYNAHCQSCAHEPELTTLEPSLAFCTSAVWQCMAGHSYVQYLPWHAGAESESEREEEEEEEEEQENSAVTEKRVPQNHRQLQDAGSEMEDETASRMEHRISCTPLSDLPGSPAAQSTTTVWPMEELMNPSPSDQVLSVGIDPLLEQSGIPTTIGKKEDEGSLRTFVSEEEGKNDGVSQSSEGGHEETPETLQVAPAPREHLEDEGCELSDHRPPLEASQLIIITGSSYEALTSDGIQLNVGSAGVEEVTCTLIEDMAFNQMSPSGAASRSSAAAGLTAPSKFSAEIPHDAFRSYLMLSELPEKHLLELSEETSCSKELQRSLSRAKRSRRGPVIEADGMLKMFHCTYEGCSQVYVAISSFQNHVNLVHRKGRTKICPHPGCGKKFYLSNHLHRHMIIHSGVRDFICETCGKSFKRKNHLEVHRRTHTGETPLQCEICGYQCRQRASLNWHMRKHTSEAHFNFTCEHCGKRFEKLDSVKFHKLKSHPDKQAS
ncbi:hypothetical protein DNTS_017900 [Danionella cerebrum]|uniref:Zinc finger protein 653 n=1 Tax=Danionella cerebrum TaxID=2873325 RepID=A0A553MSA0_9TELE|nr:hypothetical protein DNTS_017900 [Danionella translucida]